MSGLYIAYDKPSYIKDFLLFMEVLFSEFFQIKFTTLEKSKDLKNGIMIDRHMNLEGFVLLKE